MTGFRRMLGGIRWQLAGWLRPMLVRLRPRYWYSEIPPDFLIVGLQKCGTYWLTALLDSHPEISSLPPLPGGAPQLWSLWQ